MSKKKKAHSIYDFNRDDMTLKDFLAVDRTALANERTFLAYIRTGIGFLAIAISLIKLFHSIFTNVLGALFVILAIVTSVYGLYRYKRMSKKIEKVIY